MMKTFSRFASVVVLALFCRCVRAQTANTTQQLVFAGLRSVAQQGQINGVQTDSAGNLYLLLNQGDGVRLLKTDNAGNAILAQALLGATGDAGVALALDPAGNVYVTGTSSSSTLTGTSGAAIPTRTDSSTNSFVAKFDTNLNSLFVSFTGGSRIAATALAATADAVFVTGITYAANLPVTSNGIQQTPAYQSTESGFIEKFSSSGATLLYATYLTGAAGTTTPAAIAADSADAAYIVGATTATGFPTINALVPAILSNPSGFLTKLTSAGDGITFSTFVPGAGLTSIALDSTGQTLLIAGSVALGQFPVDTAATPLIPTNYQVLLRIPIAGNAVTSSTVIAPGTQSFVAAAASGGAWVDGVLSAPLLPLVPLASLGSGFAVHVPAGAAIDQTARFGGLPNASPTYASLPAIITSLAVDASGEPLIAGAMQPTASSGLLATETYDLPLRNTPTTALPSTLANAELSAATCTGSLCAGSAAYLAKLNPSASAASLAFSSNALPFIVLRNLGSGEADNLQVTTSAGTLTSNCGTTLYPGGECDILLSGGGAGTLAASSSNSASQSLSFPAYAAPTNAVAFFPKELDFGIQNSTSATGTRVVTVSNLGTTSQTFASALDATIAKGAPASPFSQTATDCTLGANAGTYTLAAGGTCHITLGLTAPATASSDGLLNANWNIGGRDVLLTGYSQAAALSVSTAEVDFGTQYTNGVHLPRYLYLSNASANPLSHAALNLPPGSAFTLTDACPSILLANTICRIRIDYAASKTTSTDSVTLTLDQGLSVLITGQTLPPQGVSGQTVNPYLSVTPTSASFTNPVAVTAISSATQTVTIANGGTAAFTLSLSLTGDFTDVTGCGATLAGGQSCTVVISFAPSQPGTRQGLLAVTAGAGTTPVYVALSGTGAAILPANNGTLSSGSIAVGQPVTTFYKIAQPFTTLAATATGPYTVLLVEDAGFGPGTPASSAYSASFSGSCRNCYLGVQFTPTASGVQTGTLTLASTGSAYVLALTGIGLPTSGLLLTPLAQDFGPAAVHSSSGTQLFTLTNLSTSGAAVAVATPVASGDFGISTNPSGGSACGGTLAHAASCFVAVDFAPTATGSRTGSLSLTTATGSATATLTGLATADPGIAINPLALTFANVGGTTSTTQTVTLTNTGAATIAIGAASVSTPNFTATSTCGTLTAGASCTVRVTFVPGSAAVADTLSLPVTTSTGGTQTTVYSVALTGSFTASSTGLEIVPGSVQYGPLATGSVSATRQFTINNLTSKTLALNVVIPRQFVLSGAPCVALAANASCSFSLAFAPLTNNTLPGTIAVQGVPSDGSATLSSIAYAEGYGTGAGMLTVTGALIVNSIFNFGQVTSGQTSAQTFILANLNAAGSAAITVRRVTSGPPFLSTTTCGAALTVGQTCTVTVAYSPSNQVATGTLSPAFTSDAGSLIIESDAASSPNIIDLTGQGAPVATTSPANAAPLAGFSLSQTSLTFQTTTVGNVSAPQTVTLANTGTITVHVSGVSSAPDFTAQNGCTTVVAGATCAIVVSATPQSVGTRLASLEIASDSGTSLEFVTLVTTGSPSPLSLSASALSFGPLLVGNSTTQTVQVTNISTGPVLFAGITATGDYTPSGTCPQPGSSLAAGQSCTVQVTFHPTATGSRAGTLSLASSASTNPLTLALSGTGIQPELSIAPSPTTFGSVALGASATLSVTLTNNGTAPITSILISVTGDYAISVPCSVSTLTAGASCAAQVVFTPSASGIRTGTLTVVSSDAGSPATIQLSGTGQQGGSFTLTVSGGPSASASVSSGQPATYQLELTPVSGFAGTVALTCTPVTPAQYASCSLLPSTVTLNGAQTSVATINTITSTATGELRQTGALAKLWLCLLFPGLLTLWRGRRNLRAHRKLLLALLLAGFSTLMSACGSKAATTSNVDPNARYTPAGTYQFQVSASSTSGVQLTQTVALNLTVTAR